MKTSLSSNAILAKSRAMYGRRLTAENYTDLMNCRSVGEVATYLKTRTAYADIFEGIPTIGLHRGRLEDLLKKRLLLQYASLCKYEMSIGQDFYKYFIVKNDIVQILTCVRLLNSGRSGEYLFSMPAFFNEHTDLDLYRLAEVTSFAALLEALDHTPYRAVLEPFANARQSVRSTLDIEAALYRYFYTALNTLARDNFRGKRLEEILRLLQIQADMRTIVNLYRLKRVLGAGEGLLRQFLLPDITRFTEKEHEALIQAPTAAAVLTVLKTTVYGRRLGSIDEGHVEIDIGRYLYDECKKSFRFSVYPTVVMFAYIVLAEKETENITHITEGVRYEVPPEKIAPLLIGTDIR